MPGFGFSEFQHLCCNKSRIANSRNIFQVKSHCTVTHSMSLVEQLFPAAELAAMKDAVLSNNEPAPKRRKLDRQHSQRSYHSADSGYNSDESHDKPKPTLPSLVTQRRPSQQGPPSPSGSVSEEEDFCQKIARARARLYSNASINLSASPSPPQSAASPPALDSTREEYHSPVSVESLASTASTSGCGLGTFIDLGLAVTSYERNLLTSLAPEPKALPIYDAEVLRRRKMMWMQRRRALMEAQERQRKTSYQGFAISLHDDEDEEEAQQGAPQAQADETPVQSVENDHIASPEQLDDFFNIEAASEEASPNATKDEADD